MTHRDPTQSPPGAARRAAESSTRAARWVAKTLELLWHTSPSHTLALAAMTLVLGLIPIAQLGLSARLIDSLVHRAGDGTAALLDPGILAPLAALALLYLLHDLLRLARVDQQTLFAELVSHEAQKRIAAKCLDLDLAHFDDPELYDLQKRAGQEAGFRPMALLNALLDAVGFALTGLSYLTALFLFEPWLAGLLMALSLPNLWLESRYQQRYYDLRRGQTRGERRESYFWHLLTHRQAAKEVRVFELGHHLIDLARRLFLGRHAENVAYARAKIRALALARSAYLAGFVAGYVVLVVRVLSRGLSLGDFVLYTGAIAGLQGALKFASTQVASVRSSRLFIEDFFRFLETPALLPRNARGLTVPRQLASGLEVQDVTFAYPTHPRRVLEGINLQVAPGESVALVGENGSGKTTLAKLLGRLYAPSSGRILLDGHDLAEYRLSEAQAAAGAIYQDFLRYQLTARENIGFGNLAQIDNDSEIRKAARQSELAALVDSWPEGYETLLSPEHGGRLWPSEGQWQRFAMARALIHDSPILILDEPTASLDVRVEHELFKRFRELTAGRITILISHRLSMARLVDRIYVLRHGRITEQGHHDQLMAAQGYYAELYRLQAEKYGNDAPPTRVGSRRTTMEYET